MTAQAIATPSCTGKAQKIWPTVPLYGLATYAITSTGTPTPDKRAAVEAMFDVPPDVAGTLLVFAPVAVALIGFTVFALAFPRIGKTGKLIGSGLIGGLIGFAAGFGLDLFTVSPFGDDVPGLTAWQWAGLAYAGFALLMGGAVLLASRPNARPSELVRTMRQQGQRVTAYSGLAMLAQGAAMALLVLVTLREGATLTGPVLALAAAVVALIVLEVVLEVISWRAADERMRAIWLECLGMTAFVGISLLVLATLAQALGLIGEVPVLAILVSGYLLYWVVSLVWMAVRAPDFYADPIPEEAA